ncbi:MAG: hypothetical protein R2744_01165 [Bacteroidales bacterium]
MDKSELIKETLLGLFRDNRQKIESNSAPIMNSLRDEAMEQFMKLGVPGKKHESYRYTNLEPWFAANYESFSCPNQI